MPIKQGNPSFIIFSICCLSIPPITIHAVSGALTVSPLAAGRSPVTRISPLFSYKFLTGQGDDVVIWAGNSATVGIWGNTLQERYQQLGGNGQDPRAYDDLFFITINDSGAINIQKRHFGKRLP